MSTIMYTVRAASVDGIEQLTLASSAAELEAVFAPGAGMVGCSLRDHGVELLAQRDGLRAYAERGATMGIPLLYPWANRLAGFGYEIGGRRVELDRASPLLARDDNGLPIHGVIAGKLPWELLSSGADGAAAGAAARLRWDRPELLAVFPFEHELEWRARLAGTALTITTTVHASGAEPVPVSFGYHPYLRLPGAPRETWQVELPCTSRALLDEQMIPTGASEPVRYPRFALGDSAWDDAFDELAAPPRFTVGAGARRIALEFVAGYPYAQVFAPRGGEFICFEPMTAPINSLRSGDGLRLVAPGDHFEASFEISLAAA